ncbi:MAG: M20/M25/M40 family metallo-hydrolase, partial [Planctomycetota bacterium]
SPPTMTLNLVIENKPAASNITVGRASVKFFLRPMPQTPWEAIVEEVLQKAQELELELHQIPTMHPVHTPAEGDAVKRILQLLGQSEAKAVCYATDGCFLQELNDMLVIGPGSIEQAHRPDEFIELAELALGADAFESIFRDYCCRQS